eukprot:1852288-Amphidinium_carterae.1
MLTYVVICVAPASIFVVFLSCPWGLGMIPWFHNRVYVAVWGPVGQYISTTRRLFNLGITGFRCRECRCGGDDNADACARSAPKT